jgi:hypothetical protein
MKARGTKAGAVLAISMVLALLFAPLASATETHPSEHGDHFSTPVETPVPEVTVTPDEHADHSVDEHAEHLKQLEGEVSDGHDDGHGDGHGGPRIVTPDRQSRLSVIGGFALFNSIVIAGAAVLRRRKAS